MHQRERHEFEREVLIFAGSFLLFLVQPMVARMALPRLGGAPAVWNSAMVVYQALLLGGYAYAHFAGKYLKLRQDDPPMSRGTMCSAAVSWRAEVDRLKTLALYPA